MSEFSLINLFLAFLLGGLAALVGVLFLFEGRRQKKVYSEGRAASNKLSRNLSYLAAIGLPLVVIIAFSAYWLPIVLSREDNGERSAKLIEGKGVTLVWAPAGPGWNQQYYSWNALAFYGVSPVGFGKKPGYENRNATLEDMNQTGLCCYLSEDGLTVMDEPQYIWRMPTADEIVRSLVRDGNNAGCIWDGQSESAVCPVLPDKETPLWAPDEPPIYYWAVDEYNESDAYYVSYNGKGISHQPKSWGNQRHGYRFVKEP